MVNDVYLGFGANKENKIGNILKAVELINSDPECEVIKFSSLYETKPYGGIEQKNYINAAAEISTRYSLLELLNFVKAAEKKIGRTPSTRWGAREIDIDILLYYDFVYSDDVITVPHKEMIYRDFVLVPLIEICPDLVHPVLNKKLSDINNGLSEKYILNKFNKEEVTNYGF